MLKDIRGQEASEVEGEIDAGVDGAKGWKWSSSKSERLKICWGLWEFGKVRTLLLVKCSVRKNQREHVGPAKYRRDGEFGRFSREGKCILLAVTAMCGFSPYVFRIERCLPRTQTCNNRRPRKWYLEDLSGHVPIFDSQVLGGRGLIALALGSGCHRDRTFQSPKSDWALLHGGCGQQLVQ